MAQRGSRTVVDIPLTTGLKEKTSPEWIDPTTQADLQNVVWLRSNEISKRPGWTSESLSTNYPSTLGLSGEISFSWGASSLSNAIGLVPNADGYTIHDGLYLYNNSENQNYNEWVDYAPPCVGTRRTISSSIDGIQFPTVAEYNGVRIYVGEDYASSGNNVLVYSIVDAETNARLAQGTIDVAYPGHSPRVVIMGTYAVIFYCNSSNGYIYSCNINLASLGSSMSTPTLAVSSGLLAVVFDAAVAIGFTVGSNYYVAICYSEYTAMSNYVTVQICSFASGTLTNIGSSGKIRVYSTAVTTAPIGARWDAANARLWVSFGLISTDTQMWGILVNTPYSGGFSLSQAFSAVSLTGFVTPGSLCYNPTQVGVEVVNGQSVAPQAIIVFQSYSEAPSSTYAPSGVAQQDTALAYCRLSDTGTVAGPIVVGSGLQMISRPFAVATPDVTYGARVYSFVASVQSQTTHFLVEWDVNSVTSGTGGQTGEPSWSVSPRACATFAPRLTYLSPSGIYMRRLSALSDVTNTGNTSAGTYTAASVISQTTDIPSQMSTMGMTANFSHPARGKSVRLGDVTYMAGGVPGVFDGVSLVESSNLITPQLDYSLVATSTGGHLTNGQTYFYIWVPEWRDSAGNVHYGQPTTPISVTIPGSGNTGKVTGLVPQLSPTRKGDTLHELVQYQAALYLVPYRTMYVNGAMSTEYYRLASDIPGSAYANAAAATNSQISFSDTLADNDSLALLYTTGGVLENDAPSSFADICVHNNRVYGIGDDLRTVWISTQETAGVPCTFNDGSQFEVPFLGDLVSIWSMDANLFIASNSGIAYVQGSGPNITGTQNDISPPTSIPSDVGVVDPRAVCVTPIGTVFRTKFGLALLDRSLSIHSDFGDPIYTQINAYPNVTSIQLHPSRPEILVWANNGSAGIIFSFNYRYQSWSYHLLQTSTSTLVNSTASSYGNLYQACSDGTVWRENTSLAASNAYLDTNSTSSTSVWVPLSVTTSWIKPGQSIQGQGFAYQVLVNFTNADWSNMAVGIAYDYSGAFQSPPSWNWTSAEVSGFTNVQGQVGTQTTISLRPPQTRCTAFQVQFTDSAPTSPAATTGQGPVLATISVEIQSIEQPARVPSAQRG